MNYASGMVYRRVKGSNCYALVENKKEAQNTTRILRNYRDGKEKIETLLKEVKSVRAQTARTI